MLFVTLFMILFFHMDAIFKKKGSDRHGDRRRKNSSARTTIYQIHIINIA